MLNDALEGDVYIRALDFLSAQTAHYVLHNISVNETDPDFIESKEAWVAQEVDLDRTFVWHQLNRIGWLWDWVDVMNVFWGRNKKYFCIGAF